MDDFVLKFAIATLYVMVGGGILVWVLNYIVETLEEITQMTIAAVIGGMIAIGIITVIALNI